MYRYRLYELDGTKTGEANYAVLIQPGEVIWTGDRRKLRVVDMLPTPDEDEGQEVEAGAFAAERRFRVRCPDPEGPQKDSASVDADARRFHED